MKNKRGISLIVLVITILVMIILAGVVVVTMQDNNPIQKAKEATDVTNIASLKDEYEIYKATKIAEGGTLESIILSREAANKTFTTIGKLKGKVAVVSGKLGVDYSFLSNEQREFAISNSIINLEDKGLPDADISTYVENGKTYIKVDAVDLETDVESIVCTTNGQKFTPNINYEKILINLEAERPKKYNIFFNELRAIMPNVTFNESNLSAEELKKYNVLVAHGMEYGSMIREYEREYVKAYYSSTKENPFYIITTGNDTSSDIPAGDALQNPLITVNFDKVGEKNAITAPLVDNVITREIEKIKTKGWFVISDKHRRYIKFREPVAPATLTRYYKSTGHPDKYPEIDDEIGMLLDKQNGRGWFHMQDSGVSDNVESAKANARIIKAAICKMTGSRTFIMEANPGTYNFEIKDLAGNKINKTITI